MRRFLPLVAACALCADAALALPSRPEPAGQGAARRQGRPLPVEAPVRDVTVRVDRVSGRARRVQQLALGASGVVYDNTCASGYYLGLASAAASSGSRAAAAVDQGRVPSPASAPSALCSSGQQSAYDIDRFRIRYCTTKGGPLVYVTNVWDAPAGSACPDLFGTAPSASLTVVGLPGSASPGQQACYSVTVLLGTPGFTLLGGAPGERFAWAHEYPLTTGSDGPLFAGNPAFGGCAPCAGTIWERPVPTTNPGTGLGAADSLWIEEFGGAGSGCQSFGSGLFASLYLQLSSSSSAPPPPEFAPAGPSTTIYAAAEYAGELYVGGPFDSIGGVEAHGIARWDGARWSAVGSGPEGVGGAFQTYVSSLVVHAGELYVGGSFTTAGGLLVQHVARWNGASWSRLGPALDPGVDDAVLALAVYDDGSGAKVHAGGLFELANGSALGHVARFDAGTGQWQALSSGGQSGCDGPVLALVAGAVAGAGGPALYVGGLFERAGNVSCGNLARWSGTWSALSGVAATDGVVQALALWDDGGGTGLFLGGDFAAAGGAPAARVARWRGGAFAPLGTGLGNAPYESVRALVPYDAGFGARLYALGSLSRVGSFALPTPSEPPSLLSPTLVGRWDGASWFVVGGAFDGALTSGVVLDLGAGPELHVAGEFTSVAGQRAVRLARLDPPGSTWSAVEPVLHGAGLSGPVRAATSFDDGSGSDLYVGGEFRVAGDVLASHVARWDPPLGWVALGGGVDGPVHALAAGDLGAGARLFVAGSFSTAGAIPAENVAAWDGASWSSLSSGTSGAVRALAVHDAGGGAALFAAGDFRTAGGLAVDRIARWDGTAWSALPGGGPDGPVWALASFDDGSGPALYAAGRFDAAGGAPARDVARWDGASWRSVGTGLDGDVHALFAHGGFLYAGGEFASGGPVRFENLARWNGSGWSAVGGLANGTNGPVFALGGSSAGGLYVGGRFNQAGGSSASNLARWSGSAWAPVDSGVEGDVLALHARGAELFAAGSFALAGPDAASFLASFPNF